MKLKCQECGHTFEEDQYIDEREESYQGQLYEPYPINCPECGSELETAH